MFGTAATRYHQCRMSILFFIVFIDLVGFGLVIPLLPFYAVRFGATAPEVTWLMATYSLMQLLAAPFWGRLSDRIGRRPVLMTSMAASALAYLWLGAASQLWMLFAARALARVVRRRPARVPRRIHPRRVARVQHDGWATRGGSPSILARAGDARGVGSLGVACRGPCPGAVQPSADG